jgi:hypothetical protein
MISVITGFLSKFKLYIYAAIVGAGIVGFLAYGHSRYEKGYEAATAKQTDAIIAYQKIVVKKEQEHAAELAQISTEHATAIAKMESAKPIAQEKIRVITKTIDRPASCDLQPNELQAINEAVHSANASGASPVRSGGHDR